MRESERAAVVWELGRSRKEMWCAHVRCARGACAPPSPIISTLETDCSGASMAASVRGVAEHGGEERVESVRRERLVAPLQQI